MTRISPGSIPDAHLDAIRIVPDPTPEETADELQREDPLGEFQILPDGRLKRSDGKVIVLSKQMWAESFCGYFDISSHLTGLASLGIDDNEKDKAVACADAIYEICIESRNMHWMIAEEGKWMGRFAAISLFAFPKAKAVRAELRSRRPGARLETNSQEVEPDLAVVSNDDEPADVDGLDIS